MEYGQEQLIKFSGELGIRTPSINLTKNKRFYKMEFKYKKQNVRIVYYGFKNNINTFGCFINNKNLGTVTSAKEFKNLFEYYFDVEDANYIIYIKGIDELEYEEVEGYINQYDKVDIGNKAKKFNTYEQASEYLDKLRSNYTIMDSEILVR